MVFPTHSSGTGFFGYFSSSQQNQIQQHPPLRQGQICCSHLSFITSHFSSETKLLFHRTCLPFSGCPCGSPPAHNINLQGFWICFLLTQATHAGEVISSNERTDVPNPLWVSIIPSLGSTFQSPDRIKRQVWSHMAVTEVWKWRYYLMISVWRKDPDWDSWDCHVMLSFPSPFRSKARCRLQKLVVTVANM